MYFFVDESGHTGANLFDKEQPKLYYGVLSSKLNIDNLASEAIRELRTYLGVDRLHANDLGMGRLVKISEALAVLQESLSLCFDFYSVNKVDHALICFFDQVFDCKKRSMSHRLIGQGAHRDRGMPHTLIGGCRTQ